MYVFKGIHFNSYAIPDPYYPYPCQNNGTCDGVSGNATYVCPPEYKGPTYAGNIPLNRSESGRFGRLKSDSTHHFLEIPVPSQGHYSFHSFPVVD
jgi:hypothetical protein